MDKGTGLSRIAGLMGIDASDFAAIGDSENDLQLLAAAGFGVAVGNAHPVLADSADLVTAAEYGAGVVEAIQYLASCKI